MNEERENRELPPLEARSDSALALDRDAGVGPEVGVRSTQTSSGPVARSVTGRSSEMVSARLAEDHLEAVEVIQRALGVSRSDALREAVTWLADVLSASTATAAKKALAARMATAEPAESKVNDVLAAQLLEALRAREKAYRELSMQVQKVGNNYNQMQKLGHLGHPVDTDALAYIGRGLTSAVGTLQRLSEQDARAREEVRRCRL